MDAKIDNFSEMESVLSVKNDMNDGIVTLFGRFGLGNQLRHLSLEKVSGLSAATLIISLCLFRINGVSIFGAYRERFKGLLNAGKNSFYRMMVRSAMDWRRLLLSMCSRFFAILRKEQAEHEESPRCYILDDTTLEKAGRYIENVSRVFDHVNGHCVLGFKLLLLAFSDGISTLPVDFSLHREKGRNGNFGLTKEERKKQFHISRRQSDPDKVRAKECNRNKIDMAIEMLQRAWKHGIRAQYLLADSWFACEKLIQAVRSIGKGAVHYIGLAKMGKTRYEVRGRLHNARELITLYAREETHQCKQYKCLYISLRARLGNQPVRIFLIKYGRRKNWNILLCSDMEMGFVRAFELYQMRWNIEVLNKECKRYLALGRCQGRNFNGQIADCTLCFITYIVLALGKRFASYETMGEIFREEKELLQAMTLWNRILSCMKKLLTAMAKSTEVNLMVMLQELVSSEDNSKQVVLIADALNKYCSHNQPNAVLNYF